MVSHRIALFFGKPVFQAANDLARTHQRKRMAYRSALPRVMLDEHKMRTMSQNIIMAVSGRSAPAREKERRCERGQAGRLGLAYRQSSEGGEICAHPSYRCRGLSAHLHQPIRCIAHGGPVAGVNLQVPGGDGDLATPAVMKITRLTFALLQNVKHDICAAISKFL
jgi:hypothetical protein